MAMNRFIACLTLCWLALFAADTFAGEQKIKVEKNLASAEILWDTWGVPHIFADDFEVLNYALGYASGRDHSKLIMRLVGIGTGRASEYWGRAFVPLDIRTWSLRLPQFAEELYELQDSKSVLYFETYANGFNDYWADHPEEFENDEWDKVMPVTGRDLFAHCIRVYFEFSYASASGMITDIGEESYSEELMKEFKRRMGDTDFRHLAAFADHNMIRNMVPKEFQDSFGSNGWAINNPKTAPGTTLLDMNPHLPFLGFFTWYEAQLVVESEDFNLSGVGFAGVPGIEIGFNDYLGWTHTVNIGQRYTGYDVEMIGDEESQYYFDGKLMTVETEEYTFKTLLPSGEYEEHIVIVEETIHGYILGRKPGHALSIRFAGIDRPDPVKEWWDMGASKNMAEFKTALSQLQISMFTVIAASRDGDILSNFNGYVPVRSFGDYEYWSHPAPGNSSEYLWYDLHPWEDLPLVENPDSGFVQNCNEPHWSTTLPLYHPGSNPDNFPPYVTAEPFMSYRSQISSRLLTTNNNITFDKFVEMKMSTRKEQTYHLLDDLLDAVEEYGKGDIRLNQAADILREWDRNMDVDSKGAVLFKYFLKNCPSASALYVNQWDENDPINTPNTLADPKAAVSYLDTAIRQMTLRGLDLDVAWGDVYRIPAPESKPTLETLPGNGDDDTFRNGWYTGKRIIGGDSYVGIVEFNKNGVVNAGSCLSYGNSSPGAKSAHHVNDQMELFSAKQLKPAWRTREDILANLEESLTISI